MTRINHRIASALAAILIVQMGLLTPAIGVASAQHTPDEGDGYNPVDDWLHGDDGEIEEEQTTLEKVRAEAERSVPDSMTMAMAGISGASDRFIGDVWDLTPFAEEETNAQAARQFRAAVHNNSGVLISELNNRTSVSSAYDTHAISFEMDGSENVTVYAVGNVTTTDNGTSTRVESLTLVNETSFESEYNRTVDEHWVVDDRAAEDLDEVTRDVAERLRNDEDIGTAYQAKLGGRYCEAGNPISGEIVSPENCDVRSTLWLPKEDI